MQLSLLGPVEAVGEDGTPLALGGPRQRALLAYLLLHANRVVAADRLVEELWESPPRDAHAALQNQVSRLRKVLGDRLVTRAPGYLLRIEPGELDLDRFRAAVAEAGSISDLSERSRVLREADGLFRGAPLADVDAPFAAGEAAALDELRLAAVEARVDADLERGRHAELVPELGTLVGRYPLRERLRGQHILALYRCGRQAEALEAYRETRRMLDEQLGLEPSPALRELERAILTQDPALASVAEPALEPTSPASEPVLVPQAPQQRQRRAPVLAFALGVALLAFAGAATAVVLTHSSSSPASAKAAGPTVAALPPATKQRGRPKDVPAKHPVVRVKHTSPVKHTVHVKPAVHAKPVIRTVIETMQAKPVTAPRPATTVAKTTTAPKPAKPPATTTPAPAGAATFTDDFSETTPNTKVWNIFGDGSGYAWALQNGRLILTIPADAQTGGNYNMVSLTWGLQCRFERDFDERIDYQLLEWPDAVGGHLQINSWVFPKSNSSAGRMINQYDDQYNGQIDQSFKYVSSHDSQGSLRLARVNGIATAYYLANGKWVVLNTDSAPGQAMLGIQLYGMASEWTHKEFRVALDNFTVTGSGAVCP